MTKPEFLGSLGLRDIELFNLGLLAREDWHILQDLGSLSACILKARYCPDSEFLQTQLGNSPSRIWRVIVEGRDVLSQGLIRRIGNGTDGYMEGQLDTYGLHYEAKHLSRPRPTMSSK